MKVLSTVKEALWPHRPRLGDSFQLLESTGQLGATRGELYTQAAACREDDLDKIAAFKQTASRSAKVSCGFMLGSLPFYAAGIALAATPLTFVGVGFLWAGLINNMVQGHRRSNCQVGIEPLLLGQFNYGEASKQPWTEDDIRTIRQTFRDE